MARHCALIAASHRAMTQTEFPGFRPAHDPGGKRSFALAAGMRGGASMSGCGSYRTLLWREWGDNDQQSQTALWIGMNPSVADAQVDDPTILRELQFTARLLGICRYVKANVMDYRATSPKILLDPQIQPCSLENITVIRRAAAEAAIIVLAFGRIHKRLARYGEDVTSALKKDERELWCLGRNTDGSPKHPLYLRGDTPLVRF
jgi:hypothetical protein